MSELKRILIERDEMTSQEADELINEMKERVLEGEDPEEILSEISLEPDYFMEIMPF